MEQTSNYQKHTSNNPLQRFLLNNFFNKMVSLIKPLNIESILDVGCGEGFTLARLKKEKIGKELYGIDSSDAAIELGSKEHKGLLLDKGDIYKIPYPENHFDLVLCTEVLEHLDDPQKALKEIIRVSKRYILLSVPNEPWFMLGNFLRGKNWSRWGNDIEHIQHWSSNSFELLVRGFELEVIRKSHPFPWTMLLLEKTP